ASAPSNPTMPARHNEPTISGSLPSVWNEGAGDDWARAGSSADRTGRTDSPDRTGRTDSADTTGRTGSADTTGRTGSADRTGATDGVASSGAICTSAPLVSLLTVVGVVVGARPIVSPGFSALGQVCEKIVTMSSGAATGGVTPTAASDGVTLTLAPVCAGGAVGLRAGTGTGAAAGRTFLPVAARYQQRFPVVLLAR